MFSLLDRLYSNQSFQMRKQLLFKTAFFYIKIYKIIHPTLYQHKFDFLKSCWYIYSKFNDLIYFLFSIYLVFKITIKEILFHERKQFFAVRHALENIFLTAKYSFFFYTYSSVLLWKNCFLFKLFLALSENNEYKTWA